MSCPECGDRNREGARFCDSCGTPLEVGDDRDVQGAEAEPTVEAAPLPEGAPESVGQGRFELVGFLGQGTRKQVFAAREADSGRTVAVALFNTEGVAAGARARSRREVEAMARLGRHPHIVPIVESGEDDGRPFIVSEYMAGGDLEDTLDAEPDRRLEPRRAIEVAHGIATGLAHAHSKGIVHRDIKPANVWLREDGTAVIGDFGLALSDARSREAVERMVVGTAAYLPPEQAIGKRADHRADLYSLGALLFEMLTGRPPFTGDDAVAIISRHLSARPPVPSQIEAAIPAQLDKLVAELLEKDPESRPPDAASVAARLERIDPDEESGAAGRTPETTGGEVFVGRERELESLKELLERAISGRGGVGLVEGEPGIGKSRLVEEVAAYARIRGAQVLETSCQEADSTPAYWPFTQAIRAFIRGADPVGLAWQLGGDGPELARLVPELRELVPSIREPAPIEGDEGRFRFYAAVASFLESAAESRPVVVIFDDLHWADSSSLALLRFLAHRVSGARLAIFAAYRDEIAASRAPLGRAVEELDQVSNRVRLTLEGLEPDAVRRFIELATGAAVPEAVAAEVHAQTGGNPFFLGEVVRLLDDDAGGGTVSVSELEVPRGVSEAVSRRLDRLGAEVCEVLEVAAVLGRESDPELVAELCGRDVTAELGAATSARVLVRGDGGSIGFAHAVFHEVLYESIDPDRREGLHLTAAKALESGGGEVHSLARHFAAAGPAGEPRKAFDYALAAADDATGQLAHADAAEHLRQALEISRRVDDDPDTLGLRIRLGEELTRSGRFSSARRVFWEAVEQARERGDLASMADAAGGIAALSETGNTDWKLVETLDEIRDQLDPGDQVRLGRVRAWTGWELQFTDPQGRARQESEAALELGRETRDTRTLMVSLAMMNFLRSTDSGGPEQRIRNSQELIDAAREGGDRTAEVRGHAYLMTSAMQAGDMELADRALADYESLAERLAEPRNLWHVPLIKAGREIMRGDFAAARRLSAEGATLGKLAGEPLAAQFHAVQLSVIHQMEGTVEELLPTIRRMAEAYPGIPAWRLALTSALIEADRAEEARSEFAPIAARGFDAIPRDANWLIGLARIGEAAANLEDEASCAAIYDLIKDLGGEFAVIGRGVVNIGPADRYIGLTAAGAGRPEEAIGHLERAAELCERVGDRPNRAESLRDLGEVLLRLDRRDRAAEVLGDALEEGHRIGMSRLVERAVRVRLRAQGVETVNVGASIDSVASAVASERPDLGGLASGDGRVTILFSDIENSTLMTERLGDERWIEVLREHNSIFRNHLGPHSGYEVKNQGDGFMLAFPDPAEAVAFAATVQRDLDKVDVDEADRIRVRMGAHVGEAIEEEGDFFGRTVILAARIAARARGGEILISEALHESCLERVDVGSERELELKGLAGSHRVFPVEWHETATLA